MVEELIKELDEKVEFLIDKNIRYIHETERLRGLLDSANSNLFASEKSNENILSELIPLTERILSRIEKQTGGE